MTVASVCHLPLAVPSQSHESEENLFFISLEHSLSLNGILSESEQTQDYKLHEHEDD